MPAKYKKPKPIENSMAAGIPTAKLAHTSTRKTLKRGKEDEASTGKQETSILEALGVKSIAPDPPEEELPVSKKPRKTPIGVSSGKESPMNSFGRNEGVSYSNILLYNM